MSELFDAKELAARLKRTARYVYAMKAHGFKMPGGRATVEAAVVWLDKHPAPRARGTARQKGFTEGN